MENIAQHLSKIQVLIGCVLVVLVAIGTLLGNWLVEYKVRHHERFKQHEQLLNTVVRDMNTIKKYFHSTPNQQQNGKAETKA